MMKLHTFFRSSASCRVRIAMNLKGLFRDEAFIHLSKNGGEQFGAGFNALNPQHLLPVIEDDGLVLPQSLAIIEYLDETHPAAPLLPADARGRARVRALSQAIACDIHPVNNLRVLKYLSTELGVSDEQKNTWYRHWVGLGLEALERQLAASPETGLFCHGNTPTMAAAAWCRSCTTHAVSNARWTPSRPSSRSTSAARSWTRSRSRAPKRSRTRTERQRA